MMRSPNLKRLYPFIRPERYRLGIGFLFLIIGSGLGLFYPKVVQWIIDGAIVDGDVSQIDFLAAILIAVFIVQGLAVSLRYYLFTFAGERIVMRLRDRLFKKIHEQEVAFFDFRKTGELMSRLASDTASLQKAVSVNLSMGARNLMTAVGGLALLIYTSFELSLFILAIIPFLIFKAFWIGKRIRVFSREAQDAIALSGEYAEESIAGVKTVKAFSQKEGEAKRYDSALQKALTKLRRKIFEVSSFMGVSTAVGYLAIAGVIWYGGRMVIDNELSIGTLTSFLLYMFMVAFSIGALAGLWTDFMSAFGAAKRVFEILDRKPKLITTDSAITCKLRGEIEFKKVSFAYPTRERTLVINDMSFKVNRGDRVALVGPSGGGKSTISALLLRFYDPGSGEILIDGKNLKDLDLETYRRQVAIVPQDPLLFSMSIKENILYGASHVKDVDLQKVVARTRVDEFVHRLPEGFDTPVGERGLQLSGGQRQRVALARALVREPKILILDEATSSLDSESEYLVKEALDEVMKGRTSIIIAHRLSTIQDADSILVIEGGRILERGSHADLVRDNGAYANLVRRQFSGD